MTRAKDQDNSHGVKLLKLFLKLMMDGKRHYQSDLARQFECSPQTIIRLIAEIEAVAGVGLEMGMENRRRYYQMKTFTDRRTLGLKFEELRYLSICRDFAAGYLPRQVLERVDNTIFNVSLLMADQDYNRRENAQKQQIGFKAKGYIDYTSHFNILEKLVAASHDKIVCLVDYKANARKESKSYFYAPGRIVSMNGTLYVHGHQVSKGWAERGRPTSFLVHRILDVTQTDKNFEFDSNIDDQGAFGMKWHEPKQFRIRFASEAADYVRERIWSEDQNIIEMDDGGIILELSTVSERELMSWVWSFGALAEIEEEQTD